MHAQVLSLILVSILSQLQGDISSQNMTSFTLSKKGRDRGVHVSASVNGCGYLIPLT